MRYLLITPPFVQLNTPYPATAQLKGYLKSCSHEVMQCDLGIECANKIFNSGFLSKIFTMAFEKDRLSTKAKNVAMKKSEYLSTIDSVWNFLSGSDNTIATRIASRNFLPEANRFKGLKEDDLEWAYGVNGIFDKAKQLSTLYIEDLAEFIGEVCDSEFSLVRYQEQIALACKTFDNIYNSIKERELNDIEKIAIETISEHINSFKPDIIGLTIPFPGTLVMALRIGEYCKVNHPDTVIAMGGGYVNTELREIRDVRFFEFIDYLLFDDGELPLKSIGEFCENKISQSELIRAIYCEGGELVNSANWDENLKFDSLPAPDFSDLENNKYCSLLEFSNPMHKLWSDGRWNKLTMAHGCYWAKCAFCDTKLDYIKRYDAPKAQTVVDRMKKIMAQTGISGFHFTDEAMPPQLLKQVCEIIIKEGITVSFWGNVRFEKSYNSEFCQLLAKAGCIAVSGGLEVASERVLKLINKGVTLQSSIECCANFNSAGIMVHTYLMYGFPSQTAQEGVDSLEIVRQMFEEGVVQSAFWHHYAMTIHSESGCNPSKFGAQICDKTTNTFANNGVEYQLVEGEEFDWQHIGKAMNQATHNYMLGKGYDIPLKNWFGKDYDRPKVSNRYVSTIIDRMS
ncbi:MAG: B12-binding domain-containing radical SAM protein [Rikenellaceae bacterium]